VILLRDFGAAMSPFNAFQFIQGLETLPLRMREHCRNAAEVALYLQRHPAITRIIYAGLHENAEDRRRAATYLNGGFGGLVGFELKGGREAGARFIDALKMFYHVANIGDVRSLAIHPASTTHSQLSAADQAASGVTPGYVRLSVGIEHIDDIIADLDQALAVAVETIPNAA
jgi:O-acetylhomoserine (thiol)-lyase